MKTSNEKCINIELLATRDEMLTSYNPLQRAHAR